MPELLMPTAKSTFKGRWRQVLPEAVKIPQKHLVTLEPGISVTQTVQMQAPNVQLIIPAAIQKSYTETQQESLWSLDAFIREAADRQGDGKQDQS